MKAECKISQKKLKKQNAKIPTSTRSPNTTLTKQTVTTFQKAKCIVSCKLLLERENMKIRDLHTKNKHDPKLSEMNTRINCTQHTYKAVTRPILECAIRSSGGSTIWSPVDETNTLPLHTHLKLHALQIIQKHPQTHSTPLQSIQHPDKGNKPHSTTTNTAHISKYTKTSLLHT